MTGLVLSSSSICTCNRAPADNFHFRKCKLATLTIRYIVNREVEHNLYIFLLQNKNKIKNLHLKVIRISNNFNYVNIATV